ncbi:MAG: hypothetical protein Q8N14_03710, partial [Candidatus Omnitrophota bacterium]|nr:hypothetical protein [Candidatus Omnitrophota bacterium]
MLRKILMILVVSLFLVGASKSSWAMNCHGSSKNKSHQQIAQADIKAGEETSTTVQTEKKAEEVGNKFCPVTGEKIEEKTKATYEYQG